jgi:2-methylisocitrate lyase-like PEP mutase family enzyme
VTTFRQLHRPGDPFILANAWDAGSARVLAGLGAAAIGTTSAGHAFTLGRPDLGNITRQEALDHARVLVEATPLPVSADLENGFGHDPEIVAETVRLASAAGLAGCSIEDTCLPDAAPYDFDHAVARIRAAVEAARSMDDEFVLLARADGLMRGGYDLDEAIRRIQAFASVGADCVYVPVLPDVTALERVCRSVEAPVNVLAAGHFALHPVSTLAAAGVARISLGSSLARVAHRAIVDAGRAVLEQGDLSPLAAGASAREVDELLSRGGRD